VRSAHPREHRFENGWLLHALQRRLPREHRGGEAIQSGAAREDAHRSYRKLWVSLVEKVYHSPTGFDGLSHPQKLYFAVCLLEGEVCNGGFHQYFFNNAGSYYAYAEEGLIVLGAFQTLELLQEAKDVVFPSIPVPISIAERRRALPSYPDNNSPAPKCSEKLDDLGNRYWADSDGITLRLEAFARNHGLLV
jgi:hypothetical protein